MYTSASMPVCHPVQYKTTNYTDLSQVLFLCIYLTNFSGPCEPGTYGSKVLADPCKPCEKGSYQDLKDQMMCKKCDKFYGTVDEGSKSPTDCKCRYPGVVLKLCR